MREDDGSSYRGFNYYISLGNRALAHRMAGRIDEALATLDRALQLSPNYARGWQPRFFALPHSGAGRRHATSTTGPLLGRISQTNAVLVRQLWENAPTS